jgi:acyl CoA:acetate/3-ketoacid CoA transferase alpha subunit
MYRINKQTQTLQAFIDAVKDGKTAIMAGMEYVVLSRNYYEKLVKSKTKDMEETSKDSNGGWV